MEKHVTSQSLFEQVHQFTHLLHRITHYYHKQSQVPMPHPGQSKLLLLVLEREPIGQKELVELLDGRPSSLSELLQKLEAKGLVERTPDQQDKRNMLVSLTEQGREMAGQLSASRGTLEDGAFSTLSEEEQAQLSQLLAKVTASWQELLSGEEEPPHPPVPPHHGPHGPHPHHLHHPHGHGPHGRPA